MQYHWKTSNQPERVAQREVLCVTHRLSREHCAHVVEKPALLFFHSACCPHQHIRVLLCLPVYWLLPLHNKRHGVAVTDLFWPGYRATIPLARPHQSNNRCSHCRLYISDCCFVSTLAPSSPGHHRPSLLPSEVRRDSYPRCLQRYAAQ